MVTSADQPQPTSASLTPSDLPSWVGGLASRTEMRCAHPGADALIVSHRGYVIRLCVPCLTAYCGGSEVRTERLDGRWASVSQDEGVCLDLA